MTSRIARVIRTQWVRHHGWLAGPIGGRRQSPGTTTGRRHGKVRRLGSMLLVGALSLGCAATVRGSIDHVRGPAAEQAPLQAGDRVLVMPLRDGICLPVYGNHVMCHLTGEHLETGLIPDGTGEVLGGILSDELQARGVHLVPYATAVASLSHTGAAVGEQYRPALGVRLAKEIGATKVVMGVVARYEERSGSWLGSRAPAAVAFSLELIDVSSGVVTHKLRFNRRQAPLTSNLLMLPLWWRQGFGWWTRQEVAEEALIEASDALIGLGSSTAWTNMPRHPAIRDFAEWQTEPSAVY